MTDHAPTSRPRTSRQRYRAFVEDYRQRRLDALTDAARNSAAPERFGADAAARRGRRRAYVREYLRWLRPHRFAVGTVFALAVTAAGLQLVEPLFMRHIIDRILLPEDLDPSARVRRLNTVGGTFLAIIIVSNLVMMLKDYRQRLLNVRVMLTLRRALFDRFLHLPLPRL